MRNLKKVLSLVLCLAMMLSIMVMGAGAAFTDQDKIVNKEAVDMCSALNIINGYEDNSYRPEGNITRAETTKLIAMMLNGGKEGNLPAAGYSSFSDVLTSPNSKWASPYIEYCVADGIVCGWDGMFAPDNNVTATEAAKMLLVSLGYKSDKEGFEGTGWNVRVNVKASQVGLYNGLKGMDVSAPLTRDNAAQMIWNALQANTVLYSPAGQAVSNNQTLLAKAYGATVDTGVMAQIYYNKDTKEYTYSIVDVNVDRNDAFNVIGGEDFLKGATTFVTTADYSDLFAMNVTVLHKGNQALLIRVNEGGTVVEGVYGDINFNNTNSNTFTVNGQKYRLDNVVGDMDTIAVPYNGLDDGLDNVAPLKQYSFRAIDLDGGGDVDLFVYYPYVVLNVDNKDVNGKGEMFTTSVIDQNDAKLFVDPNTQDLFFDSLDSNLVNEVSRDRVAADPNTQGLPSSLVGNIEYDNVKVVGELSNRGYVKVVPATFTAQGEDTYTALEIKNATPSALSDDDELITLNGTQYTGELLIDEPGQKPGEYQAFEDVSLTKSYNYVEVNGYLFILDGAGVQAPAQYAVVTDVANNTTGTTANVYSTDLLLTTGKTVNVEAKVALDKETHWPIYTTNPVVGVMYTYQVDNAGDYILTRVKEKASLEDNNSIYDVQEAYKTGACLSAVGLGNTGDPNVYSEDAAGDFFFNNGTKYYVDNNAAIFVYYSEDDSYDVITGAELDTINPKQINWAFTGASEKANGSITVDLGYVYSKGHNIDEVTYDVYVTGAPSRIMEDGNGDFYVTIPVLLSDGTTKKMESKHVDLYEDAELLKDLYGAMKGDIYKLTVLDNVIIHNKKLVDMVKVTVTSDGFNADDNTFTVGNVIYKVNDDTAKYLLNGKQVTDITKGDTVLVPDVAPDSDGIVVLTHLVYGE